jgi:hypothetical protein
MPQAETTTATARSATSTYFLVSITTQLLGPERM